MFDRIPQELKELPQWVCWRLEDHGGIKPTKVPYSVNSGAKASTTNPLTWVNYETAVAASSNFDGIGFVLSENDPYAFIDLDDAEGNAQDFARQKAVFDAFNSYAELSPGGKGLHIIVKGHVPAGRKRKHIEVYSQSRFMTMTGNVFHDAPIREQHALLNILWTEMGGSIANSISVTGTLDEAESDKEIYERASRAANGQKFKDLFEGKWQSYYVSQSEADFALIDILAFYTKAPIQIRRLFALSNLGQREKAKRSKYVGDMIDRSFDRQLPALDLEGLQNAIALKYAESASGGISQPSNGTPLPAGLPSEVEPPPANAVSAVRSKQGDGIEIAPRVVNGVVYPPGMLGEIAQFIFEAAPRPVAEIALSAAIGLMAGITGRAYNISNTGLNYYMILLANTGSGKEAMSSGIDKLIYSLRPSIPAITQFIGPGDIASGQALMKYLASKSQSFVSIIGEFDKVLGMLMSKHQNAAQSMLRKNILDLYNKSGAGQTFRPYIYSDQDKNTAAINSPAFSILGECTAEKFYGMLDESMVSEGLLPRFSITEYTGKRVDLNKSHGTVNPSNAIIARLQAIVTCAIKLQVGINGQGPAVVNIPMMTDAEREFDRFNKFCDDEINSAERDAIRQLWNRAHVKAMKLAGLCAVGIHPFQPVVSLDVAGWAMNYVEADVRSMLGKFEGGEIGSPQSARHQRLLKVIDEYSNHNNPFHNVERYGVKYAMWSAHVVPYQFLSRRLVNDAKFTSHPRGSTEALKETLKELLDQDVLRELSPVDKTNFGSNQRMFIRNAL
jgi:hypothetical protein